MPILELLYSLALLFVLFILVKKLSKHIKGWQVFGLILALFGGEHNTDF